MLLENPSVVAIGTILDGKFRVSKEIGRGGMAAIYEAENIDIGKRVAVKVLSAELASSKVVTERFMREARAAAKIRSPYICDVYDVGTYGGRPFLVMELLEGESLYDRLARDRRLSPKDTILIANETAMGLQQAHDANIVHRDLKPENIFLSRGGGGERSTKIVDFGLAKFYEPHLEGGASARLTKEGALFGTPAYMSPEQASAQGPIGHRSDLWALGCIVYEMLVGRTVWNVDQGVAMILAQIASGPLPTPSKVCPDLPKSFDAWFAKALDRDESRRFDSALELSEALRQALAEGAKQPTQSPTYTAFEAASADALVAGRSLQPLLAPPSLKPLVGAGARTPPPVAGIPSRMPPFRRRTGRWLALSFAAIACGVVGAVAWVYVEGPPRFLRRVGLDMAPQPVETEPYAVVVGAAQEQLADGEFTDAVATFEHAFENGEKKAARSLRSHVRVVDEAGNGGRCQLRGLGHPRPFDLATKASRPTFARVGQNLIAAWVASTGAKQHGIYTSRLDYALRRISAERMVTPEVTDARDPQLFGGPTTLLLLYSDARGKASLIYGRELDSEGLNMGPPRLLNGSDGDFAYDPALARAADGSYWVVYTQADDRRVHDLYLRHMDSALSPLAPPVRVTAYAPPEKLRTVASFASIELGPDMINIAYRLQRGLAYQVVQLRISPEAPQVTRGGLERGSTQPVKAGDEESDRFVGQAVTLGEETGVQAQPRITCLEAGCLTVWSDETHGAQAVFLDKVSGEVIWRKNFAPQGSRPALGHQGTQAAVVWYENDRVKIATIDAAGLGEPSVVGWVKGLQPYPEVVAGAEPGQWYISWRAYEAAIFEPFVARVDCN
jgi:eukaryotic-like serine/threonine-protein kinase